MRVGIYYPIHFLGIFLLFMSLGALCIHCRNGGNKQDNPSRKLLAITHGVGLLLSIIGGMGLMKAYALTENGFPAWIMLKMTIWLILGSSTLLVYKYPKKASFFFFSFCALGFFAATAAKFKTFEFFISYFRL